MELRITNLLYIYACNSTEKSCTRAPAGVETKSREIIHHVGARSSPKIQTALRLVYCPLKLIYSVFQQKRWVLLLHV